MLKITAYRYVSTFADSAALKRLSNAVGLVSDATKHILPASSTNLLPVSEKRCGDIAPESKPHRPWYPGTMPDPDSPDYEEFEKAWIEGCKIIAEDIKKNERIEEDIKIREAQGLPKLTYYFEQYTPENPSE